ncbi:MAG TPA: hypothetical protein VGV37_13810 [Aliidongia sp.]|uniref:hypothetical protein n=1 Tax=Aliidongia sp. TaxID=1914230 RepID=UPI002DDCDF55|nr:hypothetical protein [Aliidongia sp.]HEV2675615.1 hypothetical protein [Aliidongia sp.]
MSHATQKPDLGQAHGTRPDRGAPSGHTPDDHADHRRAPAASQGPDHTDPTEKARPHDTDRSGA